MKNIAEDLYEFLKKEKTVKLLNQAESFINLLEDPSIPPEKFYFQVHDGLVELYMAGHQFEMIPLKYFNSEYKIENKLYYENRNCSLISRLLEEAFYWDLFDPLYFEVDGKPGTGWKLEDKNPIQKCLVDDLADIYYDLKVQLTKIKLLESNQIVENGLWDLKWSFTHHWGKHCIDALRYFHYLFYDGKERI